MALLLLVYCIVILAASDRAKDESDMQLLAAPPPQHSFIAEVVDVELETKDDDDDAEIEQDGKKKGASQGLLLGTLSFNFNITKFITIYLVEPGKKHMIKMEQLSLAALFVGMGSVVAMLAITAVGKVFYRNIDKHL